MTNRPQSPAEKDQWVRPDARRGRGALSSAVGRFERETRVKLDDGWGALDADPAPLRTTLTEDKTRSIINYVTSPDLPFDRTINPYRGCEHGCIYCFARPTHAYLGLSPGLDFESKLFYKPRAAELLDVELRQKSYQCRAIALGTNTDPYQPVERDLKITRSILQKLAEFNHPFGIVTKSHLVTRDIDIIAPMAAKGLASVALSVTTLDHRLARRMEPRASTPKRRLDAIAELTAAGIPTHVMVSPVIPGLTDHEMEKILEAAYKAGARGAGYIALRLPHEVKTLFREWLAEVEPNRAGRVMDHVTTMRSGKDNDTAFGQRMRGLGPYADLMATRFEKATKRMGFNLTRIKSDISQFSPPPRPGDQLALF